MGYHLDDIEAALDRRAAFRRYSLRRDGRRFMVDVDWQGRGTCLEDIDVSFYSIYGYISEASSFVNRGIEAEAVTFSVLTGSGGHGHVLEFRLGGARIAKIIADTYAMVSSLPPGRDANPSDS